MNRDDFHPNSGAGLQTDRLHTPAVPLDGGARRRLAARAVFLALVLLSVAAGALADLGLRWLGLPWPPVFTLIWGLGALLSVGVGWTRFELRAAAERAARRRDA